MGKHFVIVEVGTEKAATTLKKEIENKIPLVAGKIRIQEDPPVQPLNEIIEQERK